MFYIDQESVQNTGESIRYKDSKMPIKARIYADGNEPVEQYPIDGTTIEGLSEKYRLLPGSLLINVRTSERYLLSPSLTWHKQSAPGGGNQAAGGGITAEEVEQIVAAKIAEVVASAPQDLDTLKEIADYIASDKTKASEIETAISDLQDAISNSGGGQEIKFEKNVFGSSSYQLASGYQTQIYCEIPAGRKVIGLISFEGRGYIGTGSSLGFRGCVELADFSMVHNTEGYTTGISFNVINVTKSQGPSDEGPVYPRFLFSYAYIE